MIKISIHTGFCLVFPVAEHYLKSIHTLDRPRLLLHEEATDIANIGMYLTGILSLLALSWQRAKQLRFLPTLIFIGSLITFGLMANAGRLGASSGTPSCGKNQPLLPRLPGS